MSEYQYYEFQSIDHMLTRSEQDRISKLSSRVQLTSNSAIFTYSYGDFRGDEIEILHEHFDTMLYMANWGTRRLAFRLPISLVDPKMIEQYCYEDIVTIYTFKDCLILDICFNDEEGGDWIDGEGWLAKMYELRRDILQGDFRALYLAWLKATSFFEEDDEDIEEPLQEPPVPANLGNLSPQLREFIEFFEIDQDLIDAASKTSSTEENDREKDYTELIVKLTDGEKTDFLLRLIKGETNLDVLLLNKLREKSGNDILSGKVSLSGQRTVSELQAATRLQTESREEKERLEAEKARIARLDKLSEKEPEMWRQVELKQTKAYDSAIKLLIELRELAEYKKEPTIFRNQILNIYGKYSNRPALVSRLKDAGLL